ncbi:uncharacterized protein FOMMEDRAFT_166150 [Fomitiporia mediterranea MF3/22]|uniref:uncharacterized protein n=1 Tax=Fomitiporia mediterranea (strain MF3/22) TaxID=694068 RepID=UPI0004408B68|nr:uncharacterized protein FOMMEDRAFT_166150 [Fomitiporia mediterranea MF3/22]EJD05821.1 hypothetical protein FOMMEDRAFT_166150 [Fomitiporia mediterranea MF3/22]
MLTIMISYFAPLQLCPPSHRPLRTPPSQNSSKSSRPTPERQRARNMTQLPPRPQSAAAAVPRAAKTRSPARRFRLPLLLLVRRRPLQANRGRSVVGHPNRRQTRNRSRDVLAGDHRRIPSLQRRTKRKTTGRKVHQRRNGANPYQRQRSSSRHSAPSRFCSSAIPCFPGLRTLQVPDICPLLYQLLMTPAMTHYTLSLLPISVLRNSSAPRCLAYF